LLIYCLVQQRVYQYHESTKLRICWTFGAAFNR